MKNEMTQTPLHPIRVCPDKDIVCGPNPNLWCERCPNRIPANGQRVLLERISALEAENVALLPDAERYRQWRKGKALTVVVPTPSEDKPNRKVTVMFGPHAEEAYGDALDAAIDAKIKEKQ